MADLVPDGTLRTVTLHYIYTINGKVVNKVLKFQVTPEQFKQYEQNSSAVDFGTP